MAIVNKPDMNYGTWAENGNIEIPSSEKVEEGWVVEKPLNETMNWLQNRQDRMLQYINERGIPEWDSRTQYPLNAFVARSGTIYRAISQNQDTDPTLHPDIWKIAFVSYSDFLSYSDKLDNIENEEGYLDLYVSKKNPVMTGAAKAPSYNSENNTTGVFFTEDVTKVRKGLSVVAEFSGGTNPKDVVTHEQLALAIQVFKVGAVYTTTVNENPSVTFGYGTWERFAKGRALVGFTDEVSNALPEWVKTAGREFGSYEHILTEAEMPRHTHPLQVNRDSGSGKFPEDADGSLTWSIAETEAAGGDQPHNNVQPSIVVYFWKRTA